MEKILVTGASGFIGQKIYRQLIKLERNVCGTVRNLNLSNLEYIKVADIGRKVDWKNILKDVSCIIHCAGKAHQMNKKKDINSYSTVNTEGTKILAEQAIKRGVKRFIFLSSLKVNGEDGKKINNKGNIFNKNEKSNSQDFYAKSKLEAEKALWEISLKSNLEVVVLRLPLVYGYGVKGNLERLIKLVKSGIPLPLSLVKNQRSMIGIDNLVDLLIRCIDHPKASGKTFLISDDEDLSTPELIKLIASSLGRKANLFPLPVYMLKILFSVFGRKEEINRLIGSLTVDNNYTKDILNWTPPVSVEEGIRRMVQGK